MKAAFEGLHPPEEQPSPVQVKQKKNLSDTETRVPELEIGQSTRKILRNMGKPLRPRTRVGPTYNVQQN